MTVTVLESAPVIGLTEHHDAFEVICQTTFELTPNVTVCALESILMIDGTTNMNGSMPGFPYLTFTVTVFESSVLDSVIVPVLPDEPPVAVTETCALPFPSVGDTVNQLPE